MCFYISRCRISLAADLSSRRHVKMYVRMRQTFTHHSTIMCCNSRQGAGLQVCKYTRERIDICKWDSERASQRGLGWLSSCDTSDFGMLGEEVHQCTCVEKDGTGGKGITGSWRITCQPLPPCASRLCSPTDCVPLPVRRQSPAVRGESGRQLADVPRTNLTGNDARVVLDLANLRTSTRAGRSFGNHRGCTAGLFWAREFAIQVQEFGFACRAVGPVLSIGLRALHRIVVQDKGG